MPFNTYIINLDQDKDRLARITGRLQAVGIQPIRFPAILGKEVIDDPKLTKITRKMCPKSVMGGGLSHLYLIQQIYRTDPHPYAVILEDDAVPLFKTTSQLEKAIAAVPGDWDVLRLFCQGVCGYRTQTPNYNQYFLSGSVAAYAVSRSGQAKLADQKIWLRSFCYIDHQINMMSSLRVYKTPTPLFRPEPQADTHNNDRNWATHLYNKIYSSPDLRLGDALSYKGLRVGNSELTLFEVATILLILIGIVCYIKLKS